MRVESAFISKQRRKKEKQSNQIFFYLLYCGETKVLNGLGGHHLDIWMAPNKIAFPSTFKTPEVESDAAR